ncbi:MAG TPA: cation:proton antiporter [Stellaceae bacterium]|jgi:Kef-type K+ transport system membrane component KefB/nucleotide-binding universal stress UspA family protein|nr:cation:proton antiporter [Stellaceae bacterium]
MIARRWLKWVTPALLPLGAPAALAAEAIPHASSEVVFLAQIIVLLACGRLLGEAMQRFGQPAVMGQLIAGILLGPSVLGAIVPDLQHALFPSAPAQKSMIDAVAQLGILMLLLLTGMETDMGLVRQTRGAAISVSIAGISVPFVCGFALGEFLPDHMLPHPDQRLITALFLGTALSIASVKIVAATIRDLNFMRRTVGQVILASAIIDDTIGWILLAVILGIAGQGRIEPLPLAETILGTAAFLMLSLTLGRRLVFRLIRWANDSFVSEMPVITTILVIMGVMALITDAIGVHAILGAFIAGILVGQSPILTRHIDEQLRGLIVALFMPVFFGLAGLGADVAALAHPELLLFTLVLIGIASLGKFGGAFVGGAFAGFSIGESLALGCGMNARGSTEVVVATIGLSLGALNRDLFTTILAMTIVTTMAMPPMLRWQLGRLPLKPEEEARLEREAFEARGFVTNMERLLVAVDDSPTGRFASRLIGLLAGIRRIPTTIVPVEAAARQGRSRKPATAERMKRLVTATADAVERDHAETEAAPEPVDIRTQRQDAPAEETVEREAQKGYDLLVVGVEPEAEESGFDERVARLAEGFEGPFAVVVARGGHRRPEPGRALDILVPVTGTAYSRNGAEVALMLARADHGAVTVLYVRSTAGSWRRRLGTAWVSGEDEATILREIVEMGDRLGVPVRTAARTRATAADAILSQLRRTRHNLVVMGVSRRSGATLFFGDTAAATLAESPRSILFVSS